MKKNLFIITAMIVLTIVAGCKKSDKEEPTTPVVDDSLTPFIGTYDLTIVTDSLQQDGSWIANATLPEVARVPERSGRLTITRSTTDGVVDVLGRIAIASDSVDYYRTTGKIDSHGRLQLASGQDYISSVKGAYHFTFNPFAAAATVSFKVDAEYRFNQSTYVERATNTIVKRK